MADTPLSTYTAFRHFSLLARGELSTVAFAVKRTHETGPTQAVLIFEDATGRQIDLDLRGSDEDVLARHQSGAAEDKASAEPRGQGRSKLGVTAREVTLLPRQRDWLNAQSGGASGTLRRLVGEAMRKDAENGRSARNAAYCFMAAVAGNLPGFEETSRALFAGNRERFEVLIASWPEDVRTHTIQIAFGNKSTKVPIGPKAEVPLPFTRIHSRGMSRTARYVREVLEASS